MQTQVIREVPVVNGSKDVKSVTVVMFQQANSGEMIVLEGLTLEEEAQAIGDKTAKILLAPPLKPA